MIYHIFANRSNIGDWLSAKGIQKMLSPRIVTECLCDEPFIDGTIARLSSATAKDMIVIGGGGLFMDYFEPFWKKFKAIASRVPFCIWGVGCCDGKEAMTLPQKALVEAIVRKSKFCIVRDELSRSFFGNCKLPPSIPCPSINMVGPLSVKGRGILHVNNYTTVGSQAYELMCAYAREFAGKTRRAYRETNNRIQAGSKRGLADVLRRYKRSDIVLSSGLHGCIIGVAMGLKVLAVSGDHKIDAFMESVGLKDWVLDVHEVNRVPEFLKALPAQKLPRGILDKVRNKHREVSVFVSRIASQAPRGRSHKKE